MVALVKLRLGPRGPDSQLSDHSDTQNALILLPSRYTQEKDTKNCKCFSIKEMVASHPCPESLPHACLP